jgi:two-component system, NarL family, nitrate/nitrite response regulator NarL
MISITIASKYKDDRRTIDTLLAGQDDFKIASAGADGYHAVRSSMTLKPDIIIMDYDMEDVNGQDIMPIIKRNSPLTDLIALCPDKECGVIDKALKAGIAGFLLWKKDLDKLVSAVRSVFYGGLYISELAKNQLLAKVGHMNTGVPLRRHLLTITEYNIFNGIILGQTDKEIAENLNMSIGALRNCINKVKKKTGLRNRTQITVYALLSGIINLTKVRENLLNALG